MASEGETTLGFAIIAELLSLLIEMMTTVCN